MNANIERLFKIGLKPERLIIGLMSGTSVDGLDVALCNCRGSGTGTKIEIKAFETVAYDADYRREIKSVFSKRSVDLQQVCLLNEWIALRHAAIVNKCLKKWQTDPAMTDLIASHGQTIYHAPKHLHDQDKFPNATLQIGDGDHLAVNTGIITVSDFRQKHIAAGGEGAPLAVYGDYLIFSKKDENRIMLNIGGIANFTFLPGDLDGSKVFSTDTGPGNTLMDAYVQQNFTGQYFDSDGAIALQGQVDNNLLGILKENDFLKKSFPKTTGPELFNLVEIEAIKMSRGMAPLSHEDMMATLNRFSADSISDAIKKCTTALNETVIYTSGGGMYNTLLMRNIREQLSGCIFKTTESLGIDPDAKEAVLFAVLANEAVAGGNVKIGKQESGTPAISMGKISFPL